MKINLEDEDNLVSRMGLMKETHISQDEELESEIHKIALWHRLKKEILLLIQTKESGNANFNGYISASMYLEGGGKDGMA